VRRIVLVLGGFACVAGVAGAQTTRHHAQPTWPQFHYSADHRGVNYREHTLRRGNVSRLHIAWRAKFRAPTGRGVINSSVAVGPKAVYVGSDKPYALFAFRRSDGKLLWKRSTGQTESSPAVSNGRVFVGSNDGHLYAFRAATGKLLWKRDVGFEVASSSPTVVGRAVYIAAEETIHGDGVLYKLDARNGAVKWQADLGASSQDGFASAASVAAGVVYVGTENGQVLAFSVRCSNPCLPGTRYEAEPGAEMGTPAVNGNDLYVTGDGNNGTFVYAFTVSRSPVVLPRWKGDELTPFTFSTPAVDDRLVYVQGYKLYAYPVKCRPDGGICKPHWKASVRGFAASPAVANGVVYIGSTNGRLYAFGAKCARGGRACTPLYASKPIKNAQVFGSSPAVAGGRVYYGAFNRVRAFALR
jgi:outer membrane protein assembly factor BamB